MRYTMTEPCDACPFLKRSGFTYRSLTEYARGEFACHKTCDHNEETGDFEPKKRSLHCAGALIFLEKKNAPHQMMRIAERLRFYDRTRLNMDAGVVGSPADCRRR